ncbi:hypothetical protein [Clostridium sp. Marseille-QA1073]
MSHEFDTTLELTSTANNKVDTKNIYVVGGMWKPINDAILLNGNNIFVTIQLVLNYKK